MLLIGISSSTEVSNHYSFYNSFSFGIREVNDFFEKASFEAVSIMVFFQVVSISFVLYKCTSILNVLIWLSFSFLIYSLAGPYFCLKWLLILSSFVWHVILLLWTHPYLIACLLILYGVKRFFIFLYKQTEDNESIPHDISKLHQKIDNLDFETKQLNKSVNELTKLVQLQNLKEKNSTSTTKVEDWLTDVSYNPSSDRKRLSRKKDKRI